MTAADPVDVVLFDVDDTLCSYRRSVPELLAQAFETVGVEPLFDASDYYAAYDRFSDDAAGINDLRERCFETLAADAGRDPGIGRAIAAVYATKRDHSDVEPLPGAVETVTRLRDDYGYVVGVVTNGAPEMQGQKLEAIGLADAFASVVHAGYDAPAKPDPTPFEVALDELETSPDRAVHVGDSVETDVAGAAAAGIRSAWLADGRATVPEPAPDHVLDSIASLAERPWVTG